MSKKKDAPTDSRKPVAEGALSFGKVQAAFDEGRSVLKGEHKLSDYPSFSCVQAAVSRNRNPETLQEFYKNACAEAGVKNELDKALKEAVDAAAQRWAAKEEKPASEFKRTKEADLRFIKEYVYCKTTLLHIDTIAQPQDPAEYGSRESMEKRVAILRYIPMNRRWDENGDPKGPGTTPRSLREYAAKQPLVLCFRDGSACALAAAELLKKGELTKKEIRELIPTVYPGFMRGIVKHKVATVEKDKVVLNKEFAQK